MATALKETMRTATCPKCHKTSHIENNKGEWNTTCTNCKTGQGNPQPLTPHLHVPYDPDLYAELNAPTYQLMPNGKIHYNHPPGTHDDKFWDDSLTPFMRQSLVTHIASLLQDV